MLDTCIFCYIQTKLRGYCMPGECFYCVNRVKVFDRINIAKAKIFGSENKNKNSNGGEQL
jgi:hypothetical protein